MSKVQTVSTTASDPTVAAAAAQFLSPVVLGLQALTVNGKQAHWHVRGANFVGVHELLDTIVAHAGDFADTAAERIVALGLPIDARISAVAAKGSATSVPAGFTQSDELVRAVISDIDAILVDVKAAIDGLDEVDLTSQDVAIEVMRGLDPPTGKPRDPLSWQFQAAMHGRATRTGRADRSNSLWSRCQHGSWFFLPWHRMYLAAFEAVVQHHLGDDDWSLPYWYALDPDRASTAVLPPAFREARADNALFTEHRSVLANGGDPLPDVSGSVTQALEVEVFATDTGVASFGGGERSQPSFFGEEMGAIEDTPHGFVHVVVGNDFDAQGNTVREGWMGSFFTAGLDPIFWLHHANLDRLWQVWLDADPEHRNPPDGDPAWFRTSFRFPAPGGGTRTFRVGDVLDPEALGYTYEDLSVPSTFVTWSSA